MSTRRFAALVATVVAIATVVAFVPFRVSPARAQTYLPLLRAAPGQSIVGQLATSSVTLEPVADATIDSSDPDMAFGGDDYLELAFQEIEPGYPSASYILLRFDLVGVLPTNSVVDSVSLQLYSQGGYPDAAVDVTIHPVLEAWDEATITWNNQPDVYLGPFLLSVPIDNVAGYKTFPLFSIEDWRTGDNFGLELRGPQAGHLRGFESREHNENVPLLTVEYHLPCFTLQATHSGDGADPVAIPANSPGCSAGQYVAGEPITLLAMPEEGWTVTGWNGTANDVSTSTTNSLTMPVSDHTIGVTYAEVPTPELPSRIWSFTGYVLDSHQTPLPGVQVSLYGSTEASSPGQKLATSQTAAGGAYLLGLGLTGDQGFAYYWVGVDDPNYTPEQTEPGPDGQVQSGRVRYNQAAADSFIGAVFHVANATQSPTFVAPRLVAWWNAPQPYPASATPFDPPGPPMDLTIPLIEVTQAVQCIDKTSGFTNCTFNSVTLVQGKPIAVRVYFGHTGGPTCPAGAASQTFLSGVRVGLNFWNFNIVPSPQPTGIGIWSGPGTPQWFDIPCGQKVDDLQSPSNSLRNAKWGSATFIIPASATVGNNLLLLHATVNMDGPKYQETNYNNNRSVTVFLNVAQPKSMAVRWALIDYKPQAANSFPAYTGPNLGDATAAGNAGWFMKSIYPRLVQYSQAPTIVYTGADAREKAGSDNLLYTVLPKAVQAMQPPPDSLYGWLPKNALDGAAYEGMALIGGSTGFGEQFDYGMPFVLAHEIGHNRKLEHILDEQYYDKCWPYPGEHRMLETGFEVTQAQPYDATYNELMHASNGIFLSPYTYNRLLGTKYSTAWSKCATGTPAAAAFTLDAIDMPEVALRPVFLVSGHIHPDGSATLDPLFRLDSSAPFSASDPDGSFCLEIQTASASILTTYCFEPLLSDESGGPTSQGFSAVLPFFRSASKIVLHRGEQILTQREASAHTPVVTVQTPGAQSAADQAASLTWTADDADGDRLHYLVLYSPNGESWWPIAVNLGATSLSVDSSRWPGGDDAVVRILASDGFRTGQGDSGDFAVAAKAPHMLITNPADGTTLHPYQALVLTGLGDDAEDGLLPEESLTWTSDTLGVLGHGNQLVLPGMALPPGDNVINLTGVDGSGRSATAQLHVFVGYRTLLPIVIH